MEIYYCSACDRYFSDEEGKILLEPQPKDESAAYITCDNCLEEGWDPAGITCFKTRIQEA